MSWNTGGSGYGQNQYQQQQGGFTYASECYTETSNRMGANDLVHNL